MIGIIFISSPRGRDTSLWDRSLFFFYLTGIRPSANQVVDAFFQTSSFARMNNAFARGDVRYRLHVGKRFRCRISIAGVGARAFNHCAEFGGDALVVLAPLFCLAGAFNGLW